MGDRIMARAVQALAAAASLLSLGKASEDGRRVS